MAYVHTTHSTLIARMATGGDDHAWREFCDRYGELIRSVARARGLQASDCDDVLQDVLLALRRALPDFRYDRMRGTFRGYLRTITTHVIYARLRQKRSEQALSPGELPSEPEDDSGELDEIWERQWRQYHLRQAMRTVEAEFNQADRIAFARYAVEGGDARAVAADLGMSIDQVYQAKSRIMRRLSTLIAEQVGEEG